METVEQQMKDKMMLKIGIVLVSFVFCLVNLILASFLWTVSMEPALFPPMLKIACGIVTSVQFIWWGFITLHATVSNKLTLLTYDILRL